MTRWDGDLANGGGTVMGGSGALKGVPVTWNSRVLRSDGKTSPEELIAAAHAACFSMALAHVLTEAGNPPEHLDVSANVTLDEKDGAPTVTTSEITVTGRVPAPTRSRRPRRSSPSARSPSPPAARQQRHR